MPYVDSEEEVVSPVVPGASIRELTRQLGGGTPAVATAATPSAGLPCSFHPSTTAAVKIWPAPSKRTLAHHKGLSAIMHMAKSKSARKRSDAQLLEQSLALSNEAVSHGTTRASSSFCLRRRGGKVHLEFHEGKSSRLSTSAIMDIGFHRCSQRNVVAKVFAVSPPSVLWCRMLAAHIILEIQHFLLSILSVTALVIQAVSKAAWACGLDLARRIIQYVYSKGAGLRL